MVIADQDSWDRYEAAKWLTIRRWLDANPNDDFAKDIRAELTSEPEQDFHQWLRANEDHLPAPKSVIEQILNEKK